MSFGNSIYLCRHHPKQNVACCITPQSTFVFFLENHLMPLNWASTFGLVTTDSFLFASGLHKEYIYSCVPSFSHSCIMFLRSIPVCACLSNSRSVLSSISVYEYTTMCVWNDLLTDTWAVFNSEDLCIICRCMCSFFLSKYLGISRL